MKVKVKLTPEQFCYLVKWFQGFTYEFVTELQALNIRLFVTSGLKKMIDLLPTYQNGKIKTFNIEVNQFTAIMACLTNVRKYLDAYTLSIFITLQNQNKHLLNLI